MGEEKTIRLGKDFVIQLDDKGIPVGFSDGRPYRYKIAGCDPMAAYLMYPFVPGGGDIITRTANEYFMSGKQIPDDVLRQLKERAARLDNIHSELVSLKDTLYRLERAIPVGLLQQIYGFFRDRLIAKAIAPSANQSLFNMDELLSDMGERLLGMVAEFAKKEFPSDFIQQMELRQVVFRLIPARLRHWELSEELRVVASAPLDAEIPKPRYEPPNPVAAAPESDLGELTVREWHCELSRELREPACEHSNPVAVAREADLGELKDKGTPAVRRPTPVEQPISSPTRPTDKNGGRRGCS